MMPVTPTALISALQGLRASSARVARAAQSIAASGLPFPPADTGDGTAAPPEQQTDTAGLADAEVTMLMAQRSFSAQLRVLEAAGEIMSEAERLGEQNPSA